LRARPFAHGVIVLGVAAIYFAAAKAGLALASLAPQVTLVWPATGLALVAVLLLGLRVWPGIALGAFLANFTTDAPPLVAVGIAAGNTLEAVTGGWLLRRAGFRPRLGRLEDALALVVCGALVSTLVSATIGVTSLCAGGLQPWSQFEELWSIWWLGDAAGDLVVAPLLLCWAGRPWRRWGSRQVAELCALWLATCAVGWVAFGPPLGDLAGESPLGYLAFPIVVLSALRHGPPAATLSVLTAAGFALFGTLLGSGPFARASSTESLALLQIYTSVLALTGLALGAVTFERRRFDRERAAVHATTSLLAARTPLADVGGEVLRAVCEKLDWDVGAIWGVERKERVLRCLGVWCRPGMEAPQFVAMTRSRRFERGVGLPGRVWESGVPAWIPDVQRDPNFPRSAGAREAGLHAGLGFPVRVGDEIEGVIEFFSRDVEEPDESLLQVAGTLGAQFGHFLQRGRADAALQQSRRELAERVEELAGADRRKDEFLAMLAHELRNPLAPIAAAAEILGDVASADPAVPRARAILERQVKHMVKLIDDLLDVSRISRRKVELELADVSLAAVVEHALEVSRAWIEARRHTLEVALPEEPVLLHADLTRLAQALANLLNNAAKFTPSGGHIRLEAALDGARLELRVRDDGIGIEPKLLPYVFDLFFQSATTPDRTHGGLGIGLTLVRTLVEMHGGEVSAHSDGPGCGSEFVLRLPARRGERRQVAPPPRSAEPARRLRILLVEDNVDSADALEHLLRRKGHEMHVARDGNHGLAQARALRPDVVLLDIGLPELDGFEVARQLRKQADEDGTMLVALTGYGQEADRRRALEAGFDHHLVKPVSLDELARILAFAPRTERARAPGEP
jgi:signal transduction histidine kinase/integral membrane sensor domain MASE1/ActR/RegA family two-component response regulator